MRLCRFLHDGRPQIGFYADAYIIPIGAAAESFTRHNRGGAGIPTTDNLLDFLPPAGSGHDLASKVFAWVQGQSAARVREIRIDTADVDLLLPVPRPPKLFLLAGNYADHIQEDGSNYEERENTFPYVFMKPPSTTLLDPCAALRIPRSSPHHIDWEVELAAVIGRTAKHVTQEAALDFVAGYTILNDISDRQFRPNPHRKERPWDRFFDWMHGKWHDGFSPCGPCIASAGEISDPQSLTLQLELNGEVRQSGSTKAQIFPLAHVISFISGFVTLEPGDIISTGTPAGTGSATGVYLTPGDVMVASVSQIGKLTTRVESEQ